MSTRQLWEGQLKKKSPKGFLLKKAWQTRYWRLFNTRLEYFKKKTDRDPIKTIFLGDIRHVEISPKGPGRLDIHATTEKGERVFALQASNRDTAAKVVQLLQNLLQSTTETQTGTGTTVTSIDTLNKNKNNSKTGRSTAPESKQSSSQGSSTTTTTTTTTTTATRPDFPYRVVQQVGDAVLGQVHLAERKDDTNERLVVVSADAQNKAQSEALTSVWRVLHTVEHGGVPRCVFRGENKDRVWTAYTAPPRDSRSLLAYLAEHLRFPSGAVRFVASELICVLSELRERDCEFVRLSPEYLWLDQSGHVEVYDPSLCLPARWFALKHRVPEYCPPELVGWFLARAAQLKEEGEGKEDEDDISDDEDETASPDEAGSPLEALGDRRGLAADMWRLGVLLYEMTVGTPPLIMGYQEEPVATPSAPTTTATATTTTTTTAGEQEEEPQEVSDTEAEETENTEEVSSSDDDEGAVRIPVPGGGTATTEEAQEVSETEDEDVGSDSDDEAAAAASTNQENNQGDASDQKPAGADPGSSAPVAVTRELVSVFKRIYRFKDPAALRFPDNVSADLQDLIRRLLEPNPVARLRFLGKDASASAGKDGNNYETWERVCLHPFFSTTDWERVRRRRARPPEFMRHELRLNKGLRSQSERGSIMQGSPRGAVTLLTMPCRLTVKVGGVRRLPDGGNFSPDKLRVVVSCEGVSRQTGTLADRKENEETRLDAIPLRQSYDGSELNVWLVDPTLKPARGRSGSAGPVTLTVGGLFPAYQAVASLKMTLMPSVCGGTEMWMPCCDNVGLPCGEVQLSLTMVDLSEGKGVTQRFADPVDVSDQNSGFADFFHFNPPIDSSAPSPTTSTSTSTSGGKRAQLTAPEDAGAHAQTQIEFFVREYPDVEQSLALDVAGVEPWAPAAPAENSEGESSSATLERKAGSDEEASDSGEGKEADPKQTKKPTHGGGTGIFGMIRGKVSKKKLRFQENGYDLDLSYITGNVIAMGFPSEGLEGKYRNPLKEVRRFLDEYHGKHGYKIYNLCSEKDYDKRKFPGREVVRYPFDDHNCPDMLTLRNFCNDVSDFLRDNPKGLAAVHCKAGKGRTGLVISCYLLWDKIKKNAADALDFFAVKRTANRKGVTIPSQRRYVHYFQRLLESYLWVDRPFPFTQGKPVILTRVRFHTVPDFDVGGGCDPYFLMTRPGSKLVLFDYRSKFKNKVPPNAKKKCETFDLDCEVPMQGDCKLTFFDYDRMSKDDRMFWFWVNTSFVDNNYMQLVKNELDGAVKDKKHKDFSKDFKVELFFRNAFEDQDEDSA